MDNNKFKRVEIMPNIFSKHNVMKLNQRLNWKIKMAVKQHAIEQLMDQRRNQKRKKNTH